MIKRKVSVIGERFTATGNLYEIWIDERHKELLIKAEGISKVDHFDGYKNRFLITLDPRYNFNDVLKEIIHRVDWNEYFQSDVENACNEMMRLSYNPYLNLSMSLKDFEEAVDEAREALISRRFFWLKGK